MQSLVTERKYFQLCEKSLSQKWLEKYKCERISEVESYQEDCSMIKRTLIVGPCKSYVKLILY